MTTWIVGRLLHGLTFYTLGLAAFFIQHRSRRILLAHRLTWLGVFAVCEAAVTWGDLLVALLPGVKFPGGGRSALLAVGYAYLLAFGVQTLLTGEPLPPKRAYRLLGGVHLLWLIPCLLAWVLTFPRGPQAAEAEVWVRYVLAFPGGLLTALGLRRQSYQTLDRQLRDHVRGYLRLVELAAALFGTLNLILVPPVAFFPASRVNAALLPPSLIEGLWTGVGMGMVLGLTGALLTIQSGIEAWIEEVERLQTLAVDRERISRELHDGIIQSIYAAGLLLEGVQRMIPTDPERAQAQLGRVMDSLNETIQDIRRYIFDLRSDMPDADLRTGIEQLLRDFRINTLLETELEITGTPVEITSMERRRHIFQIVREALTNTARHAKARKVKIHLHYADALNLTISDDGIGMETLLVSKGYGLRNIRERTRLLDGTIRVESAPGAGVTFHLTVPY